MNHLKLELKLITLLCQVRLKYFISNSRKRKIFLSKRKCKTLLTSMEVRSIFKFQMTSKTLLILTTLRSSTIFKNSSPKNFRCLI